MRLRVCALAVVAVVLAGGAFALSPLLAKVPPLPDPDKPRAKAFVLPDQNGETVIMSKFQGMIVVLEWMNPDCPFSKRHYREGTFKDLYKKYKYGLPRQPQQTETGKAGKRRKRQKVVWLAINSSIHGSVEANKQAAAEFNVPYPILDDHRGKVGRLYGAKTTPHLFIKAPDGTIAYQGAVDNDPKGEKEPDERINYVEKALEALLSGQAVETPETEPYGTGVKYAKRR